MLNALRHQRFDHVKGDYLIGGFTGIVLNALRHQRFDHGFAYVFGGLGGMCSTPYGIRGLITWMMPAPLLNSRMCSTPYGIRGLITQRERINPCLRSSVLNALRHQRFDHPAA